MRKVWPRRNWEESRHPLPSYTVFPICSVPSRPSIYTVKILSGFRFKSYRNLNRRPAYHNRLGVALMPPLQQTLVRIFCIKKLERHSETSVLIYRERNLLFGFVQEKLYTPITSQPYVQLYRPVPICVSNLKLESRNSKCKNCSNRSAIKPSFIQHATNLLQCKTIHVHSLNATEIIIILNVITLPSPAHTCRHTPVCSLR